MKSYRNIIRVPGVLMALSAAGIVAGKFAEPGNTVVDSIYAAILLLPALYFIFWQDKPRARWLLAAMYIIKMFIISLLAFLYTFIQLLTVTGAGELLLVYGGEAFILLAAALLFGICAANAICRNRFRTSAATALAVLCANALVSAYASASPGFLADALYYASLAVCTALSPQPETPPRAGRPRLQIAAAVALAVAAVLFTVSRADYLWYAIAGSDFMNFAIMAIMTAGALLIGAHALFMAGRPRARLLLPAGFALLFAKGALNAAVVIPDGFTGDAGSLFMLLEPAACGLCLAGCFASRRPLRAAGATLFGLLSVYYIYSALMQIATYMRYDFSFAPAITAPLFFGALAAYLAISAPAAVALPSLPAISRAAPSSIEQDLHELRQRFDGGELSEAEYETLRAERLERP